MGPSRSASSRWLVSSTSCEPLRRKTHVRWARATSKAAGSCQEYDDASLALAGLAKGEVDAVVYEAPILQYLVKTAHPGRLMVLPGTFQNHGYGFGLRTGSELRERLNLSLLRFTETDEWRQLLSKYLGAG